MELKDEIDISTALNNAFRKFALDNANNTSMGGAGLDHYYGIWLMENYTMSYKFEMIHIDSDGFGRPHICMVVEEYEDLEKLTMFKLEWG